MFLIRTAFWLTVVIFLIPVDEEAVRAEATFTSADPIETFEAVSAATATLQDVGGFCTRNPDVCEIGGRIAETFALKARTGALMLYSYLDEQLAEPAPRQNLAAPGGGTLTEADLEPAWRGPAPERSI